jgi:hypothetical protein
MSSLVLLSVPISNPFPDLFKLSMGIIAVFSVLLIIAKLKRHPIKWLHTLLFLLIICGVLLSGLSGFYSLYGPSAAEPLVPRTNLHNGYFSLYVFTSIANIIILILMTIIAFISLFFLFNIKIQK